MRKVVTLCGCYVNCIFTSCTGGGLLAQGDRRSKVRDLIHDSPSCSQGVQRQALDLISAFRLAFVCVCVCMRVYVCECVFVGLGLGLEVFGPGLEVFETS